MPADSRAGGTRILTRTDVAALLDLPTCIEAVERAFRAHGDGSAGAPAVASVHVPGGGFHVKAGVLDAAGGPVFVAKTNGNFPGNPARSGLPTIQGTLVVCDATDGSPLAVMDSTEITVLRTAAATAVAARYLARRDARVVGLVGCGRQGRAQVEALAHVVDVGELHLFDTNVEAARALADALSRALGCAVHVAADARAVAAASDVCVTCTPSHEFLFGVEAVRPGSFIAGVGADSEEKRELAPDLLASSTLVVDVLDQCAAFGDLHHALEVGAMRRSDVYAQLGAIVAGQTPGRRTWDEITVFDSTGMALQDVAAAAVVVERAAAEGRGQLVDFAA